MIVWLVGLLACAVSGFLQPAPLPSKWAVAGRPAANDVIQFIVALKHGNDAKLSEVATAVSNPRHAQYGQHLTTAQISAITQPDAAHTAEVTQWLTDAHITVRDGATKDILRAEGAVSDVERLFRTTVHTVKRVGTEQTTIRAGELTIDPTVLQYIETIMGLHGLPVDKASPLRVTAPPPMPYAVTPTVIETQYKVSGVTPSGSIKSRQAVAEFQGQFENDTDLAEFFKRYVPKAKAGDDKIYKYVGPHTQGEGVEALLDIEYIMGVAPGVKSEFWEFPAMQFCLDLVNWTQAILKEDNPPNVFSVSYGWQGNLTQIGCKEGDVDIVDKEFQKLAAKGVSIIFASGDSGSGYQSGCHEIQSNTRYTGTPLKTINNSTFDVCCSDCTAESACEVWSYNEATRVCYLMPKCEGVYGQSWMSGPKPPPSMLWPSWPASSPWVTAVGSTRFLTNTPGAEMATDQFGSGGGFSTMFKQPTWQADAVKSYFNVEPADKLPPSNSYPKDGRGTPDVAALGEGFQVMVHGRVEPVGGTSASAPTFAALISLINDHRIANGKAALGFLNQWIYQDGSKMFTDCTHGNNRIGRGPFPLAYGWDAVKGWDPVTGFGTPDFPKMLEAALALP